MLLATGTLAGCLGGGSPPTADERMLATTGGWAMHCYGGFADWTGEDHSTYNGTGSYAGGDDSASSSGSITENGAELMTGQASSLTRPFISTPGSERALNN